MALPKDKAPHEDFLHYVWRMQYFQKNDLQTKSQQSLLVLERGQHNSNAGPDFNAARILLDGQEWLGDIEIHVKSSDWKRHQHHSNAAYQRVILHVVWEDDLADNSNSIPVLELKNRLSNDLWVRYWQFFECSEPFPCAPYLEDVPAQLQERVLQQNWLARQNRRINSIHTLFLQNNRNLEETAYQLLGQAYGLSINQAPFLELCKRLPHKYIQKHADQLEVIEALLFGMASLLPPSSPHDAYTETLQSHFQFLAHKYNLRYQTLAPEDWKFMRLRPPAFPTVRLAQFAALLHQRTHFFAELVEADSIKSLKAFFDCPPSPYWQQHYDFGKESKQTIGSIGHSFSEILILNVAIYLGLFYAELKSLPVLARKFVGFAESMKAEQNKYVSLYNELGFYTKNAAQTQAVMELHRQMCQNKKCLSCGIGQFLLKSET